MRRSKSSVFVVRSGVVAVAAVLAAQQALAATNGTWKLSGVGNYSDGFNWVNGVVAGSGGQATFGPVLFANGGASIDTTVTLSRLTFDADFTYFLLNGGGQLDIGGAVIDTVRPAPDSSVSIVQNAIIAAPLVGSGGLTKTGPGTLNLSNAANGLTGVISILGGTLQVSTGTTTLSQDGLSISDAGLRTTNSAVVYSGPVTIAGNARFEAASNGALTLNGPVGGNGNFIRTLAGDATTATAVRLNASNSFSGQTIIRGNLLQLGNAEGSIRGSQTLDFAGQFEVVSSAGVNSDRFHPSAVITSRGSRLTFGTNTASATLHNVPNLVLATGRTEIISASNAASSNTVAIGSLTRDARSTLMLRGLNGVTGRVTVGNALPLVGGTGGPGTVTRPIVPFITSVPLQSQLITNSTFVTRDAATGDLLPLNLTNDFASTLVGATPETNVRLTPTAGTTTALTGGTINSLIVSSQGGITGVILSGNTPLAVRSGAILHSPNSSLSRTTFDIPLDFGTAEGLIHASSGSFISVNRPISGSGGLTVANMGQTVFNATASSTYTGVTTLLGGTVQFSSNVASNTDGPFGNSDTAVVLSPNSYPSGSGASPTLLSTSSSLTFSRPLVVRGNAFQPATLGTINNGSIETIGRFDSDISLESGDLSLANGASLNSTILNGTISGPGRVSSSTTVASIYVFNGSNSYAGGTETFNGLFLAGHDNAFGTGPLTFATAGTANLNSRIGVLGAGVQRTLANNIVLRNSMVVVSGGTLTFTGSVDLGWGNGAASGSPYNINVTASTTFTGRVFNGGIIKTGTGPLTLAGTNAYTGPTIVAAGQLNVNTPLRPVVSQLSVASTGSVAVLAAAPSASPVVVGEFSAVNVASSGLVSVTYTDRTAAAPRLLVAGALGLTSGGRLDLNNNDLVVRSGTALSAIGAILSETLVSSVAGSGSTPDPRDAFTALGVLGNTDAFGLPRFSTFDGFPVTATDVLVKYTFRGDTDLNGILDARDFNAVLNGFSNGLGGWENGDINYDGVVDSGDWALFLPAYQAYAGGFQPLSDAPGTGAAIPEPTALALLAPAALLLSRRRRA